MLPHTGLFLLWKVALQMRIRRRLKPENLFSDDLHFPHESFIISSFINQYSGLTLNQYGVASPCRTICTVCGFVALS